MGSTTDLQLREGASFKNLASVEGACAIPAMFMIQGNLPHTTTDAAAAKHVDANDLAAAKQGICAIPDTAKRATGISEPRAARAKWSCPACAKMNRASDVKCLKCKQPHPTRRVPQPDAPRLILDATSETAGHLDIRLLREGEVNRENEQPEQTLRRLKAELSDARQRLHNAPGSKGGRDGMRQRCRELDVLIAAVRQNYHASWACGQCTFVNASSLPRCEMCSYECRQQPSNQTLHAAEVGVTQCEPTEEAVSTAAEMQHIETQLRQQKLLRERVTREQHYAEREVECHERLKSFDKYQITPRPEPQPIENMGLGHGVLTKIVQLVFDELPMLAFVSKQMRQVSIDVANMWLGAPYMPAYAQICPSPARDQETKIVIKLWQKIQIQTEDAPRWRAWCVGLCRNCDHESVMLGAMLTQGFIGDFILREGIVL